MKAEKSFDEQKLLDDALKLAVELCEALSKRDLNGDGRTAAKLEILETASLTGAKWAKKFVNIAILDMMEEGEVRRWLAIAQLTLFFVNRNLPIPATRILSFIVETAVNLLSEEGS